jgi:hypothetical protein
MQTALTPTETSTVFVSTASNTYRIWWNRNGCYWQTDILGAEHWLYFGQADSLIKSMTNIAITL